MTNIKITNEILCIVFILNLQNPVCIYTDSKSQFRLTIKCSKNSWLVYWAEQLYARTKINTVIANLLSQFFLTAGA